MYCVDSAGVVPVRNLQLPVLELGNCGLSLGPADTSLLCPPIARDPSSKGVCQGYYCMLLGNWKWVYSVFITVDLYTSMKDCQIMLHLNHSVTYKQYEWILMLSVHIVLSWWHWRDICEETAVPSDKWSTQEVSTGSEHRLWWAATVEVSHILIRSCVTWKFKIREPHLIYKHFKRICSQENSVGIVIRLWVDWLRNWVPFPLGKRFFTFSQCPIQYVMGGSFHRDKSAEGWHWTFNSV
jgi:hypothetical protein